MAEMVVCPQTSLTPMPINKKNKKFTYL